MNLQISPKAIPILMIVLDVAAAAIYGFNKDWKHMIYWLAGSIMIYCITF
jgi:hypothetical protein